MAKHTKWIPFPWQAKARTPEFRKSLLATISPAIRHHWDISTPSVYRIPSGGFGRSWAEVSLEVSLRYNLADDRWLRLDPLPVVGATTYFARKDSRANIPLEVCPEPSMDGHAHVSRMQHSLPALFPPLSCSVKSRLLRSTLEEAYIC